MTLTRIDLRGHDGPFEPALPRPADAGSDVRDDVAAIVSEVRSEGDAALRRLTERFDGVAIDGLRVPGDEIGGRVGRIPSDLRQALEVAWTAYLRVPRAGAGGATGLRRRRGAGAPPGASGGRAPVATRREGGPATRRRC